MKRTKVLLVLIENTFIFTILKNKSEYFKFYDKEILYAIDMNNILVSINNVDFFIYSVKFNHQLTLKDLDIVIINEFKQFLLKQKFIRKLITKTG